MKMKINAAACSIVKHLEKNGYEVWIVGGAVRDLLLKKQVLDWDFTTNATPEQIQPLFGESFYDNAFGTVMIAGKHVKEQFKLDDVIPDDVIFDITTYRSEHGYSDKRRPDKVEWGKSIEDDLKRRDFTINAIAAKIVGKNEIEILDPYHGRDDLNRRLIRTVGDAEKRFEEDALRMLRAVRFGAQLGFQIEEKTVEGIKKKSLNLREISWERIGAETMKIIGSEHAADGVMLMVNSGLMGIVIPEVLESRGVEQAGHHIYDVFTHMVESLRACPSTDPVVRFATFLHDVAKPHTLKDRGKGKEITFYNHEVVGARVAKDIAKRLRLSKKDQEKVFILVRRHMFTYSPEMTDGAIRRFIKNVGKENIHDMMMLRIGDRIGGGSKATSWRLNELQKRIGEQLYEPLSVSDLKINGQDVMKILGIKPGPKVGKIMNALFEEVLEDSGKNTKKYLEKRTKEIA